MPSLPMRLADIRAALPGVSDQTIRLVLNRLRDEGLMVPDGVGRAAAWIRLPHHRHGEVLHWPRVGSVSVECHSLSHSHSECDGWVTRRDVDSINYIVVY
jgi:hypothetical protein